MAATFSPSGILAWLLCCARQPTCCGIACRRGQFKSCKKENPAQGCYYALHNSTHPTHRNYAESKIRENVEVEIMQVLVEEAYDSYKEEIVMVSVSARKYVYLCQIFLI